MNAERTRMNRWKSVTGPNAAAGWVRAEPHGPILPDPRLSALFGVLPRPNALKALHIDPGLGGPPRPMAFETGPRLCPVGCRSSREVVAPGAPRAEVMLFYDRGFLKHGVSCHQDL